MTLWWFPLEPLEERYTADWALWFGQVFDKYGISWREIAGDTLTEKIEEGEFLDILGRPHFAMSQLNNFILLLKEDEIKTDDKLLFADLWHHGIESIPYINALKGGKLKIYGILHAGSYDPYDFLHLQKTEWWAKYFEEMIGQITEKIFVGSEWHKELLVQEKRVVESKVVVTGLPLDCKSIVKYKKEPKPNIGSKKRFVVFPHRFAPEKGIVDFIKIMDIVFKQSKNIFLCMTTGRKEFKSRSLGLTKLFNKFKAKYKDRIITYAGLSKKDYYKILADCHVVLSCARQETFGYGILEAVLLGCTPVVPERLSYYDTLMNDKRFFYSNLRGAIDRILKYCDSPVDVSEYAWRYDASKVIGKMLKEMELI